MTDPSEYARQIESYLCRKNGGHLVRVVGPAFELVCAWAEQGLPLKVAFRGIDRCCERRNARGASRRPIRIEFCEADVLESFDEWRRAVGVAAAVDAGTSDAGTGDGGRKPALTAHVERAIARLAHARGVGPAETALQRCLEGLIRELEEIAAAARARGDGRARIVGRLGELDRVLVDAGIAELDAARAAELRREAVEELAPFSARMTTEVRDRTLQLAFERLVRTALELPVLTYE